MNSDEQRLRDALQLLADRAPTTCPAPEDRGDIQTRSMPVEVTPSSHERPQWRRSAPLVAALAAVVLVTCVVVAYTMTRSSTPSAGSATSVTTVVRCSAGAGRDATADRGALERRVERFGATQGRVTASSASVEISARGMTARAARSLCVTGALDVRPVVLRPVAVTCGRHAAPCSPTAVQDAARAGGFQIPGDGAGYLRLSAAQRRDLSSALAAVDCAKPMAPHGGYRVVCGSPSPRPTGEQSTSSAAYLLGAAVFDGDQVRNARAEAPSGPTGRNTWSVALTLNSAGRARLAHYSAKYNASGNPDAANVTQCTPAATACADYLAFVIDNDVVWTPVTLAPISGGVIQLTGGLDAATAKQLAAQLSSPLPAPLRLTSIHTHR